jgi:hypothetical protein
MQVEIRNGIKSKRAVVFVINKDGRIYQVHRVVFREDKPVAKVIDVKEDDIVVEYSMRYDFNTKKGIHLLYIIYYPKTMKYEEAFNKVKNIIADYLNYQINMGVKLYSIVGG